MFQRDHKCESLISGLDWESLTCSAVALWVIAGGYERNVVDRRQAPSSRGVLWAVDALPGGRRSLVEKQEGGGTGHHERQQHHEELADRITRWWVVRLDLTRDVAALGIATDTLRQREQARQEAAESLADQIGRQVEAPEARHERHEQYWTGAVDQAQKEEERQHGRAVLRLAQRRRAVPEEDHQQRRRHADGHQCVDAAHRVGETRYSQTRYRIRDRSDVGDLNHDRHVRRKRPSLGQRLHQERQFHPHAVHGYPRAQSEKDAQRVHEPVAPFPLVHDAWSEVDKSYISVEYLL